jgi:hypothetical protein
MKLLNVTNGANNRITKIFSFIIALAVAACVKKQPEEGATQNKEAPAKKEDSNSIEVNKKIDELTALYRDRGFELTGPITRQEDGLLGMLFQLVVPAGKYPPPGSSRSIYITPDAKALDQYGGEIITDSESK